MKIQVVIPCHLDSVRLRNKVLIDIYGLPMVNYVNIVNLKIKINYIKKQKNMLL